MRLKTFGFEDNIPSFRLTFWLIVLVILVFLITWQVVYHKTISPEQVPKITCPASWQQDDEGRNWLAKASCSFGDVEQTISSTEEKQMYWISVKGLPKTLQCWKIDYPSDSIIGCESPY